MAQAVISHKPSIVWDPHSLNTTRLDASYYHSEFIENDAALSNTETQKLEEIINEGTYGILPKSEDYCNSSTEGIYLIRGTDLRDNLIAEESLVLVPEGYLTERAKVEVGDILILIKGATIDKEWSVSIASDLSRPAVYNGSIFRCRLKEENDPYFVVAYMSTEFFLKQKRRAISNTGIFYNDLQMIHSFKIPVPSLKIQRYIGNKFRKVEKLRKESKSLWIQSEKLFKEHANFDLSITELTGFQVIVEDPVAVIVSPENISGRLTANSYNLDFLSMSALKNSNKIKFSKLDDLAEISAMIGWKNLTTNDYVLNGGVYLLRVQDIKNGYVEITEDTVMVCAEKVKEQPQIQLKNSDIVFSKDGSLGFSAVISENLNKYQMCSGSTLARIRIKKDINPYYLSFVLNSNIIKAQISYFLSGIAQPHINQEFIRLLEIPMIPPEIQNLIGERLKLCEESILKSCELMAEAKKNVEDLVNGIFDETKLDESV